MALPYISVFLEEIGQWNGLQGLDIFSSKKNNHANKWKIICWKRELATPPCHFEMCAKFFPSTCRVKLIKSILLSFSFVLCQLTIDISTVSAGWISPLPFYCLYVYEILFGIMGMNVLEKTIKRKRSARQIREVKLVLKFQFNSFLYVGW